MFRSRHEIQVLWTRAAQVAFRQGPRPPAPVVVAPTHLDDESRDALRAYLARTPGPVRVLGTADEVAPFVGERGAVTALPFADKAPLVGLLPLVIGATEVVIAGHDLRAVAALFEGWAHAHHHQRPVRLLQPRRFVPLLRAVRGGQTPPLLNPLDEAFVIDPGARAKTSPRRDGDEVWQRRRRRFVREVDETLHLVATLPAGPAVFASPRADPAQVRQALAPLAHEPFSVRLSAAHPPGQAAVAVAGRGQGVFLTAPDDDPVSIPGLQVVQRAHALCLQHVALTEGATAALFFPGNVTALYHLFTALWHAATGTRATCPLQLLGKDHHRPVLDALRTLLPDEQRDRLEAIDLLVTDVVDPDGVAGDRPPPPTTSFARGPDLIGRPHSRMLIPPGPNLSHWMKGEVLAPHSLSAPPDDEGMPLRDRAWLSHRAYAWLQNSGTDPRVQHFVQSSYDKPDLERFLRRGPGPEAVSFLCFAAPYAALGSALDAAADIMRRWGDRAEACFEKLNLMCRSDKLKNPEDLKSWFRGLGSSGPAAEGFATMLGDALDLLEAGHTIWIEQSPDGRADILDETARVAYQHKRVAGKTLATHIKKAAAQLAGQAHVPGAPPGYLGVAHIDVRHNDAYRDVSTDEVRGLLADIDPDTARLDELQVLFDDTMMLFDRDLTLVRQIPYSA